MLNDRISMFSAERLAILEPLIVLLEDTLDWSRRFDVEIYVHKCVNAGFAKTDDQIRMCAERYLAGKRKVTPPGTTRRKRAEQKMREALANTPKELLQAIQAIMAEQTKAVEQYKGGADKALNALVGGVMKRHKSDPTIVRELLIKQINR
jgi:GatB domain